MLSEARQNTYVCACEGNGCKSEHQRSGESEVRCLNIWVNHLKQQRGEEESAGRVVRRVPVLIGKRRVTARMKGM